MPPLRLDQWAVRSAEPVGARTREGFALLSTEQQRYFVLNDSAAAVWERLAQPIELRALAEMIAAAFALAPGDAGQAVLDVVAQFREQNIVSVWDAAPAAGEGQP